MTRSGAPFEERVFQAVGRAIQDQRFGLLPSAARVFRGKAYYSRDRDSNVVTDVSVEVWLPGSTQWSFLWVFECKDHQRAVPVREVEELKAKLDQIAGTNKKGSLVISGVLQSGALAYAKSNGIGVVRVFPEDRIDHLLYADERDCGSQVVSAAAQFEAAVTDRDHRSPGTAILSECEGLICRDWSDLVTAELNRPLDR